jgi:hypothetical protein
LPAAHFSQRWLPSLAMKRPDSHRTQASLPSCCWNWPAGHCTQWFSVLTAPVPKFPREQFLQLARPVWSWYWPAAQAMQSDAESEGWYCPATQLWHAPATPAVPGQHCWLHAWLSDEEAQVRPPYLGWMRTPRVRTCVPPPHASLHACHEPHSNIAQSTAQGWMLHTDVSSVAPHGLPPSLA